MTNRLFAAAFLIVLLSSCTKHISNEDKVSYLVGHQVGETMKRQGLTINPKIAAQAIADALNDKNKMEPKDYEEAVAAVQQAVNSKLISDQETNAKKAVAFMNKNKEVQGVHETKSGLQYVILKSGDGKTPHKDSVIKMNYTASLADGTKFDSTYDRKAPAEVRVSALFSGWAEGMQLISRGGKARFFIPPALAYGTGVSQKVPSNSVVVLDVELLDVK